MKYRISHIPCYLEISAACPKRSHPCYLETFVARLQFRVQSFDTQLVIGTRVAQVAADLGKVGGQVGDLFFQLRLPFFQRRPLLVEAAFQPGHLIRHSLVILTQISHQKSWTLVLESVREYVFSVFIHVKNVNF